MTRRNISTGGPWEGKIGYSRAVRVGRSVQVSGTTAMTPTGLVGKGDPYAQTIQMNIPIISGHPFRHLSASDSSIGWSSNPMVTVNATR